MCLCVCVLVCVCVCVCVCSCVCSCVCGCVGHARKACAVQTPPARSPRGLCLAAPAAEAGSYVRLIDSRITQLEAQGHSRTCNESKQEAAHAKGSRNSVPTSARRGAARARFYRKIRINERFFLKPFHPKSCQLNSTIPCHKVRLTGLWVN